jgi:hypothetical protein
MVRKGSYLEDDSLDSIDLSVRDSITTQADSATKDMLDEMRQKSKNKDQRNGARDQKKDKSLKQIAKERARTSSRKDTRVDLDLSAEMKRLLFEKAGEMSVPASQLADTCIRFGFSDQQFFASLVKYLKPSKSIKYDYVIDLEKLQKDL